MSAKLEDCKSVQQKLSSVIPCPQMRYVSKCSADEYTLQFMENNCRNYSMANWESALAAAKAKITGAFSISTPSPIFLPIWTFCLSEGL